MASDIDRLFPAAIRDARTPGYVAALETLPAIDRAPLLVRRVDSAPEAVLPHLAEEFGVLGTIWWQMATTIAAKRALLKVALPLKRQMGTRGAIRRAILALGFATVTVLAREPHWWQYRLFVQGRPITPEDAAAIKAIAADFAPARCELAELSYGAQEMWSNDGVWGDDTVWGGYYPYALA